MVLFRNRSKDLQYSRRNTKKMFKIFFTRIHQFTRIAIFPRIRSRSLGTEALVLASGKMCNTVR